MTCAPDHPGLRRRAARIVALASAVGQGDAAPAASSDDLDVDAILRGIDLLLPRINSVPRETLEAPPDHPAHVPLGDPERTWRKPQRWLDAILDDCQRDGPEVLRGKNQAELLDLWFAACENLRLCIDPEVRAFASRMARAGEAIRRGETDASGRAVPLGRMIGLQGAAVSSAAALNRQDRNRLIRSAVAAMPDIAGVGPYSAAQGLADAFRAYIGNGGFAADRGTTAGKAGRAPLSEPRASLFRLAVLDNLPGGGFPGDDTLVKVLAGTG